MKDYVEIIDFFYWKKKLNYKFHHLNLFIVQFNLVTSDLFISDL